LEILGKIVTFMGNDNNYEGKSYCKKCFNDTEIQWRSWEGEMVRLARGGGDEGAASRAAKLLFGIKMSFCGLNILKLLS